MRLFIASPANTQYLDEIIKAFDKSIQAGWSKPETLHLTWHFIGECNDDKTISQRFKTIPLLLREPIAFKGFSTFGSPPRVLYAQSDEKILFDQARALKEAGFDLYRFTPHVTFCKIKQIYSYKNFKETKRLFKESQLAVIEPKLILYQSTLTPKGAIHTPLIEITA